MQKKIPAEHYNLLIVGASWIGDMVMSQTLFQLLKAQNPKIQIDVLAPFWTRPLLACMPEVHEAIDSPLAHGEFGLVKRYRLGKMLRSKRYDQAIVLPNSFKSALVPWFANIPKRTGWRGEMRYGLLNDARNLDKEKYPLMIERFMALGLPNAIDIPKPYPAPNFVVDSKAVETSLQQLNIAKSDVPILAICPGAQFGPSKQWPPEYFSTVAQHYLDKGWQVWLFGSSGDKRATDKIQEKSRHRCLNLASVTNLEQAIHLLTLVKGVVTNDSGLMHIAAALHLPLVAIYGSSSPGFTPPLSDRAKILWLQIECSPCFKRECPLKHWRCMRELTPELVLQALEELL